MPDLILITSSICVFLFAFLFIWLVFKNHETIGRIPALAWWLLLNGALVVQVNIFNSNTMDLSKVPFVWYYLFILSLFFFSAPILLAIIKGLAGLTVNWNRHLWVPAFVFLLLVTNFQLNQNNFSTGISSTGIQFILLNIQTLFYLLIIWKQIPKWKKVINSVSADGNWLKTNGLYLVLSAFVLHWFFDILGGSLFFILGVVTAYTHFFTLASIFSLTVFGTTLVWFLAESPIMKQAVTIRYQQSRLTFEQKEIYLHLLKTEMTDQKPYRNPTLTIQDLSDQLAVPVKDLSQIINESFQQNFFDFINSYRINDAKLMLKNHPEKSVLEILFDSGFNSKTTFNRVFRIQTGLTPSAYRTKEISS